jgi:acetylcholinesterase
MAGHNTNEGPLFTPPYVKTEQSFTDFIVSRASGFSQSALSYIENVLYPADYSGRYPWKSGLERTFAFIADNSFLTNDYLLNTAYGNKTYAYEFAVPPAFHGFDIPYTFNTAPYGANPVADTLQAALVRFVISGNPNGPGQPPFPMQGLNASMNKIDANGSIPTRDPTVNARTAWWSKSLYY